MINNKRLTVPNTLAVDITAAASASNGITQASNVQNNFGTSNMAIRFKGSVPDWTPASNVILHHKHDGTNGTILTLLTTGILRTTINATTYDSTVATGMTDNYVAVIDVDITRSSASAAGSVVYTLNGVILGASVAITAGAPVTVDNTSSLYVCGTSAVRSAAQWFSHRLFNRAKTVAENLGMFVNGMAASDVGATQTAVYTSNFTSTVDGWTTGGNRTLTANQTINGTAGWLQLNRVSGGTTTWSMPRASTFSAAQLGKRMRLQGTLWVPAATTGISYLAFDDFSSASTGVKTVVADTEITIDCELIPTTTSITIRATNSAGVAVSNVTNAQSIYLKNIIITQIGITSELLGANARNDTLTVTDSSGNAQNATLPAAGATVVLARK